MVDIVSYFVINFLFFATLLAITFAWGRVLLGLCDLALGVTGLTLSTGVFARLGFCFSNFEGLWTTTVSSEGDPFSGQDVKTLTSCTL